MGRMSGWSVAALLVVGCGLLVGLGLSQGQVVEEGPGGATFVLVEDGGVYPLIFQLKDDSWAEAKGKLVERAGGVDRIEIIYALTQLRRHEAEKVQTRIDSVLAALGEAGHYPLTEADFKAQVKQLASLLRKVEKGQPAAGVNTQVLMALVRAQRELREAQVMIETGQEPTGPEGQTSGVGGIIIGGGEQ